MKKLSKVILIALVVLICLAGLGVLGINLYVQSASVQAKIERELGQQLGMPLRMTSASFTPWQGLRLTGITVPQHAESGADEVNFLDAPSVSARLQLSSLFEKRFVIKQIKVDAPKLVWNQSPDGKWQVPARQRPARPANTELATEPQPRREKASSWTSDFKVEVNAVRVEHGSFDFNDAQGKRIASFSDVKIDSPASSGGEIRGDAHSGKVSISDLVFLDNLDARFEHARGVFTLNDLGAELAGGRASGNLELRTAAKGSPFTTDLRFQNIDLNRVITEGGGTEGQATGTINGSLSAHGESNDLKTATGSGQVVLINGRIRQYEFFQSLGQALKVEELAQMDLQQAQLDYRLADGKVTVDPLFLQTANLKLTARGDVAWDGKMDLDARLDVNSRISRRLPDFIRDNFAKAEQSEARYIDFDVGGTLANPQTNLMTQMLGKKLETEVTDFIQGMFGKKKKKDDTKKKAKPQLATPPAPAEPSDPSSDPSAGEPVETVPEPATPPTAPAPAPASGSQAPAEAAVPNAGEPESSSTEPREQ